MSEKKLNQKHQKKAPVLTPEEQVKAAAAVLVAQQEAKAKRERVELYGKSVEKMSFRQLRGELRRESRRPSDTSPLTAGLASVLLTVLTNTKTAENPTAKSRMIPGW